MEKKSKCLKDKIQLFSFLFLILLVLFVNLGQVVAGPINSSTENYKEERQFIRKVQIIHEAFPNQTDAAALYATIAHRGTSTGYVKQSYDPNFDEDAYRSNLSSFKSDINSVFGDPLVYIDVPALIELFLKAVGSALSCGIEMITGTDENGNKTSELDTSDADVPCMVRKLLESYMDKLDHTSEQNVTSQIQQPRSIDLLIAATIVMLDSSSWTGTYSDENYMKALAGNGLVGNMFDGSDLFQAVAATVFNGVFCGAYFIADVGTGGNLANIALKNFNPSANFTADDSFGLDGASPVDKLSRYYTMSKICSYGFLGGTYDSLQNYTLETDEQKDRYQAKKDQIAEEIIQLADYYRGVAGIGSGGAYGNSCLTGNTQAGDLSDMTIELCAQKFGPLMQADYSRTGVLASISLAQAWLESQCGKHTPPNSNNIFGIKCSSDWTGECSVANTNEEVDGGYINISAGFRVYASVEEGINNHSQFLMENPRYANHGFFTATDYVGQAWALQNAGYATASNYASTLISIIESNDLDKWDVKTNTTSSSSICGPVGSGEWPIRTIAPTSSDQAFIDAGSYNRGQCVWYARGRAIEIVYYLRDNGKLSADEANKIVNLLKQRYGDGGNIYDSVKAQGVFNTSNDIRQPKAGSYIVWKQPGAAGHVAIVEEVNTTDNTITITEGWSANGYNSCPNDWSCVKFQTNTFDLDEFYSGYGAHYIGGYTFSGYVYFLEPLK